MTTLARASRIFVAAQVAFTAGAAAQEGRVDPPPAVPGRIDLEIRDEAGGAPGGTRRNPILRGDAGAPSTAMPLGPTPPNGVDPAPRAGPGDPTLPLPVGDSIRTQLARERHAAAMRLFRKKDYPRALQGFQDAYALDPRNPEIANDLGFLHEMLGNPVDAERYYRETLTLAPERNIALMNLADVLHQKGAAAERLTEAAQLLQRARSLAGNKPNIILRQARLAAARGLQDEAARYYRELVSQQKPGDALRIEIGDFYRDFGRDDEALAWYRQVTEAKLAPEAQQRIWQIGVEREARRYGFTRPSASIPAQAQTLTEKAGMLHKQGRHDEAERLYERALRLAPHFAMARADLGNLYRDVGRRDEAELAYLRALAFEQSNAEIYARLGKLYLATPKGTRVHEAVLFLQRALQLRPDWNDLYLRLARAYRRTGDLPRALSYVERFLAQAQNPDELRSARALRDQLAPLVQAKAQQAASASPALEPSDVGPPLMRAINRARALFARGEPHAAMAELRRLSEAERGVDVLNLEGRILFATGRLTDAGNVLTASLAKDEAQADAHEQLGIIRAREGDAKPARRHLLRADALGNPAARYHLARLDAPSSGKDATSGVLRAASDLFDIVTLWRVRESLTTFIDAGAQSAYLEEARALRDELGSRIAVAATSGGAALLLLLTVGLWLRWRLYGGIDLQTLLARHPEAGPDVQRILSAIRHEVLKHNTLVLTGLAEAIARGERAADKAAFCHRSLFGTGSESGAMARLLAYAEELEQVGRAHGQRLNLRRRDPALSALLRGFRLLQRAGNALTRVDGLGPSARARLLEKLQIAARLLNAEGYEAVRSLLDNLRVLSVDEDLLAQIFARTLREPALAEVKDRIAPLDLDAPALPQQVLIPRRAFEDILQNLLRNAIQSSLRHRDDKDELEIGLGVRLEVDGITGIERVVFLVRDRSPAQLSADVLRGRFIEEGLGLTADLVSRYDGTLDVFAGENGWSKAVVVKLPRAEASSNDRDPL